MPVGSNAERISEITEAFSKIDPNDKRTYDAAVDRFQEIMRPFRGDICSAPEFFSGCAVGKKVNVFFLFLVKILVFYCEQSKYMVKTT